MSLPQKKPEVNPADVMEGLIIKGDLEGLTSEQRLIYYHRVCDSLGVNPLTQPFQYLKLQGKLILYATRACADQLRKLHGISIEVVSEEVKNDVLIVHTRARDDTGRVDEDLGAVPFPETLRGVDRANTILRAVTKSKRRVTLSICGLGFLDETEAEDIPGAEKVPAKLAPDIMRPAELSTGTRIDRETGEIIERDDGKGNKFKSAAPEPAVTEAVDAPPPADTPDDGGVLPFLERARAAARKGQEPMRKFWSECTSEQQKLIHSIRPQINKLVDIAEGISVIAQEENEDGRPN